MGGDHPDPWSPSVGRQLFGVQISTSDRPGQTILHQRPGAGIPEIVEVFFSHS